MDELERAVQQYNAVVEQNRSLQKELNEMKELNLKLLTILITCDIVKAVKEAE